MEEVKTDAVVIPEEVKVQDAPATIPTEMITDEMRAAGVDETVPLVTREEVVAELGEEAVAKIEAEALTPAEAELVDNPPEAPVQEVKKQYYEGKEILWSAPRVVGTQTFVHIVLDDRSEQDLTEELAAKIITK